MAIDENKYVLVDSSSGEALSGHTVVAPQLEGARMYDVGADPELLGDYAEKYGVELFEPGAAGAVDLGELEPGKYLAIDAEGFATADPSSLLLVPVPEEDADLDLAAGVAPQVPSKISSMKGLPYEDLEEEVEQ